MTPEWLWLGAAVAGYLLVMVCNPSRAFFIEAYDVLRGSGTMRLLLPVAVLSLSLASFNWRGERAEPASLAVAVAADAASMFGATAGLRIADGAGDLPLKTKAAVSIGALFWVVLAVGVQFFVLVAIYLRILMPERDPGLKGLLDFAWRRTARFWPGLIVAAVLMATGLWVEPQSVSALALWCGAAVVAVTFAFAQVSLLSGERGLGDAVRWNFSCWRSLAYGAVWFMVVLVLHLFLLRVADRSVLIGAMNKGGVWAIAWDVLFALVRSGVMLWLSAAWVLYFCAKTKNPTRRKIRP